MLNHSFFKGSIFPFHNTILLRCSWGEKIMVNSIFFTKFFKILILKFTSMISSNWNNINNFLILNNLGKFVKSIKSFILVEYVCLNVVLVEFSLTRGIYERCLIRIRLNYHEESGFSISGDTIRTHKHC